MFKKTHNLLTLPAKVLFGDPSLGFTRVTGITGVLKSTVLQTFFVFRNFNKVSLWLEGIQKFSDPFTETNAKFWKWANKFSDSLKVSEAWNPLIFMWEVVRFTAFISLESTSYPLIALPHGLISPHFYRLSVF